MFYQLFYVFYFFSFIKEQHAVASGIFKFYKRSINNKDINWSLLRRNTHRIEKGMVMKNRKKTFAMNYIEETVNEFIKIKKQDNNQTVKWTSDVLDEFFSSIELNKKTEKIKLKFENHKSNFNIHFDKNDKRKFQNEKYAPYLNEKNYSKIDYDDLFNLTINRRSVRYFKSKSVEEHN